MEENLTTNDTQGDIISRIDNLVPGVAALLQLPVLLIILILLVCVYKTYRTRFQRLILYYVVLGLGYEFSRALRILLAYNDETWVCNVQKFLRLSSLASYYTYIVVITNYLLFLIPCLIRGRPISKLSKFVECISLVLPLIVALMVASIVQVKDHGVDHGINCIVYHKPSIQVTQIRSVIAESVYFGVDLEVVLASLSLYFAFCFIRQRTQIRRQTSVLLRNSVCHVAINAVVMTIDFIGAGYDICMWSTHKPYDSKKFIETTAIIIWDVLFEVAVGVSVIIQAILCIQTSTQRSTFSKRCCHLNIDQSYTAIDGEDTATNPASSRISPPSHTNFAVPYTGGFTQITASINNGESEQKPLIKWVD